MLTLLLLILILGALIFIHELGHFLVAKKSGVYIYEFSLGMGPKLIGHKGKDGINYNLRLLPIGGFVQMAGEVYEDDNKIPKEDFMCNKPWHQRIAIILAGVTNNFLLALLLLFIMGLIWGVNSTKPVIGTIVKDSPMDKAGIKVDDTIVSINGYKTKSWDKAALVLQYKNDKDYYTIEVKDKNDLKTTHKVYPEEKKDKEGKKSNYFGFAIKQTTYHGIGASIKYAFIKFGLIIEQMCLVIINLFNGNLSLSALSGPVGMYSIVETTAAAGVYSVIYLVALLSINLGFINVLPFPAFDGGRALFMIIEKIKGSPVNQKIENTCHTVGFILLMILMIFITIQDVLNLF